MFTKISSEDIWAVDDFFVPVEADVSGGLPAPSIPGHLASEVRESQERVCTALRNSGSRLPVRRTTVNLSPAGIRKGRTAYNLAIAVAVLRAFERVNLYALQDCLVIRELGLDGRVKPVDGVLSTVDAAREYGLGWCLLPVENAREGLVIRNIDIVGVESLEQMVRMLGTPGSIEVPKPSSLKENAGSETGKEYDVNFRDINGQLVLRRATEIAASGMYSLFMNSSAGTGKTMVAKRIPTIMLVLSGEEDTEISKVYSICGVLLQERPLLSHRLFRNPHHAVTPLALMGGGGTAKPGELSLASGGMLSLDELPHFGRKAIDILRQPLEECRVTITRVHENYEFPANFPIVATINPCPYRFYPDRIRYDCSETQVRRYLEYISRPILNRFDLYARTGMISLEELNGEDQDNEDSAFIRERVEAAVQIQRNRYGETGIRFNGRMGPREMAQYCVLGQKEKRLIKSAYGARGPSARRYHEALRVARAVTDLVGCGSIRREHLAEALDYGVLEDKLRG